VTRIFKIDPYAIRHCEAHLFAPKQSQLIVVEIASLRSQ
jgi:hypothetical protein